MTDVDLQNKNVKLAAIIKLINMSNPSTFFINKTRFVKQLRQVITSEHGSSMNIDSLKTVMQSIRNNFNMPLKFFFHHVNDYLNSKS